jgi:hypothetical protein
MANGLIGKEINKERGKTKHFMSLKYRGCHDDYKKSDEHYTMKYQQYKPIWLKRKNAEKI